MSKEFDEFMSGIDNKPKLKIDMHEYYNNCSDGCCTDYGTIVSVNGVEMPFRNQDTYTILKQVLEHLGYEVEINESLQGEGGE
jgi:hypothetical protein